MQQDPQNERNWDQRSTDKSSRFAPDDHLRRLRISDMLYAIRKRITLIVILAVIGLGVGILLGTVSYLRGEMSKQYLITTSIAVTSQNASGMFTSDMLNPNSTDIHLAEDMVDAVIYVIRSDRTLNEAVEKLNLIGVSAKDIYSNLKVNQYNSTQIVELNLYWRSAQEGISILTAINQVLPDILISTLKIGSVSVINEPRSKYIIGGSLNASIWFVMAMLGAMLGVGLAILEMLIRPTLLNTRDVERQLGLELLGEIPERKRYFRRKRNLILWEDEEENDPVVQDNFMAIAHILQWQFRNRKHASVAFTSASQNEGKTTIIAYLAVMLAGLGMRVLLLDLDTRNPRLGGLFLEKVDYSHSLNALYRGETDAQEAVTHLTGTLDILPTLLEGKPLPIDEAMCALIDSMKADYDLVLLDTAPVGQVAETMSLSQVLDAILLVVRFDGASMNQIRETLYRIEKSGRTVMGCIVNSVKTIQNVKREGYYGYSDHYRSSSTATRHSRNRKKDMERAWEAWERKSDDPVLNLARKGNPAEPPKQEAPASDEMRSEAPKQKASAPDVEAMRTEPPMEENRKEQAGSGAEQGREG